MLVLRDPAALRRGDGRIQVVDHRGRRVARFQRSGIDERLERGAGLTFGLRRAIEAALVEVAAAYHRAYVAGRRVHRHQRALQILRKRSLADCTFASALRVLVAGPSLDVGQTFFHERFCSPLQLRIERRIHAETALVDALPPETVNQFAADLLLEIEAG